MPSHTDAGIGYQVDGANLAKQLAALEEQLIGDLHRHFESVMGIPIPTAVQADVLEVNTAMKYQEKISVGEFLNGAKRLVNTVFKDHPELTEKATSVASVALGRIIVDGTTVQTGFQGDSAKIAYQGKTYVAACYTSTSFCAKEQWGTQSDFYVAEFVFTVFGAASHPAVALRALRAV